MDASKEYSRLITKRSSIAGVVPTIPSGNTIDSTWVSTDLLIGETFVNTADDKFWVRTDNGIVELGSQGISSKNFYTDNASLSGNTIYFDRNDTLGAYSVDLTPILTTGGTVSGDYLPLSGGSMDSGAKINGIGGTSIDLGTSINRSVLISLPAEAGPVENFLSMTSSVSELKGTDDVSLTSRNNKIQLNESTNSIKHFADEKHEFYIGKTTKIADLGQDVIFTPTRDFKVIAPRAINIGCDSPIIDVTKTNSVALGGVGLNITESNTAYVDRLNVKTLATGSSINNLGIDSSGNVVVGEKGGAGANDYTTGATLSGNVLKFDRTDALDAFSVDLSSIAGSGGTSGADYEIESNEVLGFATFVDLPAGVTSVGAQAFKNENVLGVTLNPELINIGGEAFYGNKIKSVSGTSVETIGQLAFRGNQLTSVSFPSVTSIGHGAFQDNQLTSVSFPNTVTSIGQLAFQGNQLTSIVIPDSVTVIGENAFAVNQLTSVVIPNTVTVIEDYTFIGNQLTSIVIPDSVTSIGDGAFRDNQLTSVVIPNTVTSIGGGAFRENQLTSISIPSVTSIVDGAFQDNQLTSVTFGSAPVNIGYNAFNNNNLTSVNVPTGSTVHANAFDAGVTINYV